jgi:hypothetical protein
MFLAANPKAVNCRTNKKAPGKEPAMDARINERGPQPIPASPPRVVPFLLCCHLLANGPAVWGSIVFGLSSILAVGLVCGMDPLGAWRLAWNRQEAPGVVVSERDTNYEENDSMMRRHDYTFRLPDGTELHGHSYSNGHRYVNVPTTPGDRDPLRWSRVTIEYDPDHPATNRIKGTRTNSVAHWAAFVFIFPIVALVVALFGFFAGWSQIRLLRDGELARATLTGGMRPTDSDSTSTEDLPIAECRRLVAEQVERAEKSARSPFVFVWNGINSLWCGAVALMAVGGILFTVCGIVHVYLGGESIFVNGQPARGTQGILAIVGFLVVWVFICGVMLAGGRLLRFTPKSLTPNVDCAYEFRLPDGQVVRTRDTVPPSILLDPEASLPVLYNPLRTQETILLATLSPPVQVSPEGGWQAPKNWWLLPLLAAALLAFVGGPLLGAIWGVS